MFWEIYQLDSLVVKSKAPLEEFLGDFIGGFVVGPIGIDYVDWIEGIARRKNDQSHPFWCGKEEALLCSLIYFVEIKTYEFIDGKIRCESTLEYTEHIWNHFWGNHRPNRTIHLLLQGPDDPTLPQGTREFRFARMYPTTTRIDNLDKYRFNFPVYEDTRYYLLDEDD